MDTFQLNKILLENIQHVRPYVCALDQLNRIQDKSFCVIVNSDTSDKSGHHWFALYRSKNRKYIDIFDSFAIPYTHHGVFLDQFLKRQGGKISFNNLQYQPDCSNTCGIFCLYFLIQRDKGISYGDILSHFSCNLMKNNEIVINYMNRLK